MTCSIVPLSGQQVEQVPARPVRQLQHRPDPDAGVHRAFLRPSLSCRAAPAPPPVADVGAHSSSRLQAAVKYVRSRDALRRMRVFVDQNDSDLDLWRERQSSVAQKDFYLLDMDNGAGWKFIKGAPRALGLYSSSDTIGPVPCASVSALLGCSCAHHPCLRVWLMLCWPSCVLFRRADGTEEQADLRGCCAEGFIPQSADDVAHVSEESAELKSGGRHRRPCGDCFACFAQLQAPAWRWHHGTVASTGGAAIHSSCSQLLSGGPHLWGGGARRALRKILE